MSFAALFNSLFILIISSVLDFGLFPMSCAFWKVAEYLWLLSPKVETSFLALSRASASFGALSFKKWARLFIAPTAPRAAPANKPIGPGIIPIAVVAAPMDWVALSIDLLNCLSSPAKLEANPPTIDNPKLANTNLFLKVCISVLRLSSLKPFCKIFLDFK